MGREDDEARCLDFGRSIYPGSDTCGRCARQASLTVWMSLGFFLLGLPLAATCGVMSYGAFRGGRVSHFLIAGFVVGLGMTPAGAIDLARVLRAKLSGARPPQPWATRWVAAQFGD
ncbi:MAG: hypothetical protein AB7N76_23275 [Planctomycetota bacterium]